MVGAAQQATVRTIDMLAPKKSRLSVENDRLRQENKRLGDQFVAVTGKVHEGAVETDGAPMQKTMARSRLREENKYLAQENRFLTQYLQAQNDIHTAVKAADQHLSGIFAAMLQADEGGIQAHAKLFVQTLESVSKNPEPGPLSAIDAYSDRLLMQLKKLPAKDLQTIGVVAENYAAKTHDPVIERLYFAVAAELLWRDPIAGHITQTGRPLAELRAIKYCSTLLVEQAKNHGLATHPSDTVRGTRFKLNELERIAGVASRAVSTRIVTDTQITPDAWNNMSATELEEVADAVAFCMKGSAVHGQQMERKLRALENLVKKHKNDMQATLTTTAAWLRQQTAPSALVNELARLAARPGLSKLQRETRLMAITDEIAHRKTKARLGFQEEFRNAVIHLSAAAHQHTMDRAMQLFLQSAVSLQKALGVRAELGDPVNDAEENEWIREAVQQTPRGDLEAVQRRLASGDFKVLLDRVSNNAGFKKDDALRLVGKWYAAINAALPDSATPIPLHKAP